MNNTLRYLVAAAFGAALTTAEAGSFSYSYVDGAYRDVQVKAAGEKFDMNGYDISASYLIHPNVFVRGTFGTFSGDETIRGINVDVEQDAWKLGAGYIFPINGKTDFYVAYDHENRDVKLKSPIRLSEDVEINSVEAGVRFKPITTIELFGTIGYFDADGSDNDVGFRLGGIADLSKNLGLGVEFANLYDEETTRLFARVRF